MPRCQKGPPVWSTPHRIKQNGENVRIHIYIYIYIYIFLYIYTYTCVSFPVRVHMCMYVPVHVHVCMINMYVSHAICIHHIHAYVYKIYLCIYINTYNPLLFMLERAKNYGKARLACSHFMKKEGKVVLGGWVTIIYIYIYIYIYIRMQKTSTEACT